MGQNLTTLKVCHRGDTATAWARGWGRDLRADHHYAVAAERWQLQIVKELIVRLSFLTLRVRPCHRKLHRCESTNRRESSSERRRVASTDQTVSQRLLEKASAGLLTII